MKTVARLDRENGVSAPTIKRAGFGGPVGLYAFVVDFTHAYAYNLRHGNGPTALTVKIVDDWDIENLKVMEASL